MKTKITLLTLIFSLSFLMPLYAQERKNIERKLNSFNSLIVGGYYKINLYKGEPKIVIHASENVAEKISTKVQNKTLKISNKPIRHKKALIIDLYSDYLENYDISGAVILQSDEIQKAEHLIIDISGAATVKLKVESQKIKAILSGATVLDISGNVQDFEVQASGASIIKTDNLERENSNVILSGAAGVLISGEKKITETPPPTNSSSTLNSNDADTVSTTYGVSYDGTVARAQFLGINMDFDEEKESGKVNVGSHSWVYNNSGEVTHKRIKHNKFNGHWGGFGLGINGYVNDKYTYELPKEYAFMDLLWQKSINVDINLWEQNINLSPNKNIGLITGIGYSIYNYRFTKSFTVMQDSSNFSALYNQGINVRKSKIVTNYIMIPLLFEIQDNNPSPLTKYRWHVNVGAIFGMRVHTHQKTYFDELNKDYNLVNPITGNIDATATSPNDPINKVHKDFYIQPFKVDASLRIGWGWVNMYANLSLTEMFSKNKGPKLYPFTIGIMLVSW